MHILLKHFTKKNSMMNLNILLMMLINKVSICLQEDMFSEHFDISSSSLRDSGTPAAQM